MNRVPRKISSQSPEITSRLRWWPKVVGEQSYHYYTTEQRELRGLIRFVEERFYTRRKKVKWILGKRGGRERGRARWHENGRNSIETKSLSTREFISDGVKEG